MNHIKFRDDVRIFGTYLKELLNAVSFKRDANSDFVFQQCMLMRNKIKDIDAGNREIERIIRQLEFYAQNAKIVRSDTIKIHCVLLEKEMNYIVSEYAKKNS